MANGLFVRAGTNVIPFREVSSLVTSGVYRYTRNPMYLGMALVLLGCAVTVGVASALLIPVLFMVIIELRFIRPEERMLQGLFPQDYPAYCTRVRRWI
jgi:protein-S-isoprenylcysteine O-methyltransferase Ste14